MGSGSLTPSNANTLSRIKTETKRNIATAINNRPSRICPRGVIPISDENSRLREGGCDAATGAAASSGSSHVASRRISDVSTSGSAVIAATATSIGSGCTGLSVPVPGSGSPVKTSGASLSSVASDSAVGTPPSTSGANWTSSSLGNCAGIPDPSSWAEISSSKSAANSLARGSGESSRSTLSPLGRMAEAPVASPKKGSPGKSDFAFGWPTKDTALNR